MSLLIGLDTQHYLPTNPNLWQSSDTSKMTFAAHVRCLDPRQTAINAINPGVALIGFACDEGIRRAGGRVGAAQGPDVLRRTLAHLPNPMHLPLIDVGNIHCDGPDLESAWQALAKLLHHCQRHGFKTLIFGGGRETLWGHYLGLKVHYPSLSLLTINPYLDVHEDVPNHTGTTCYQIAQDKRRLHQPLNLHVVGVQKTANHVCQYEQMYKMGGQILTADTLRSRPLDWHQHQLRQWMRGSAHTAMSLSLSAMQAGIAPGVSTAQPFGMTVERLLPLLQTVLNSQRLVSVDILELSPRHDQDGCTANLASHFAAEVLCKLGRTPHLP